MHGEPFPKPFRNLIPSPKNMTFILGSKCIDGVVLIGDRKVTAEDGSYVGYRDKIFNDVDNVVWARALSEARAYRKRRSQEATFKQ